MSSPVQDSSPQLGNTFGALFIGVILAALLYGITNVQVFIYFQTNRDRGVSLYKLAVIWLWILDTINLALIIHAIYYYLVINFANVSALEDMVWSFKLQTIPDILIVYGVHVLYAYRIWIVSSGRSRVLPAIVGILVVITSGVGIIFIWAAYQVHAFTDVAGLDWAIYLTLSSMAFNDFIIASSLCYFLATSRTGFSSTDSLLTKLMVYTINTGALTSITSMVSIIACAAMPNNFIYMAIQMLLVKLYVTSFLALMNMRHYRRSEYSNTTSNTANAPQFNNHRSLLPTSSRKSNTEILEESQLRLSQHPNEHDDELYPARHIQALTLKPLRPTTPTMMTIEMSSFSSA